MDKKIVNLKIIFSVIISMTLSYGISAQNVHEFQKLKIASSQFPVSANIDSNAYWIKKHMKLANLNGAELIHFPECALSGYAGVDFDSFENFDWKKLRKETELIIKLAEELNIWVLLGSTHRLTGSNKPHNSLYVIKPDEGLIDRYDKRFCTKGDLKYFSPGNHFSNFYINGIKCGLLICYDIRFPELYRELKADSVEVVFQSFYNARQKPGGIHPKIMPVTAQARAATNCFFMSITNSSAPNSWPCHLITPDGLIEQKLPANKPGVLISEIDVGKKYYDASKPYRMEAIKGKLHSGDLVDDKKSAEREIY